MMKHCIDRTSIVPAFILVTAVSLSSAPQDLSPRLRDAQAQALTAIDGTAFELTTGMVRVPEQRLPGVGSPARTIDLAVVRLRRTNGASPAGAPAHVILAGGPGDSGVEQALGLARQGGAALADLMQGDLIGIDQRGTGRSVPSLVSEARYGLPLEVPGSAETWLPFIERVSRSEADRFRSMGIALEAYNTRESADDVEAVREALGYDRVTLWGRSYGSHLALAVLARHPAAVDRLVLVSPEGLDHTWKLPSQVDVVLRRLEERGAGDVTGQIDRVLTSLRGAPVRVNTVHPQTGQPIIVGLGAFDVQWITAQSLGDPRLLATLPAAFREMDAGDFRRMAQVAAIRRGQLGVQSAMKVMMDLTSGASAGRRARIEHESSKALLGNAINVPGIWLERSWGALALDDEFRRPVRSDVPTLILVGDLDPRTPTQNAHEIASTLSRAQVVTLENATHQFDLFGSAPMRSLLQRFLRGQSLDTDRLVLPAIAFQR